MDNNYDVEYAEYRRRRVKRLKKIILGTILSAIVIPVIVAIVFVVLYVKTKSELSEVRTQYNELLTTMEGLKDSIEYTPETKDAYSVSPVYDSDRETSEDTEKTEEPVEIKEAGKKVYLTFDDGPSSNTNEILDILKEYDVKATFFVVGKTDEVSVAAYKRIVDEGHTLGMHSYSHKYSQIYESKEAFAEDLTTLQEYLYDTTGVWSRFYRFPGGSSNTASSVDMDILMEYLNEQDITYFDWNIVSGDAVSKTLNADTIYQNCVSKLDKYSECIILMHDAQARHTTVEALPRVIEYIQGMDDTQILPITDETLPVQHKTVND